MAIAPMLIPIEDERYPATVRARLGALSPPALAAVGNLAILHRPLLALFSSQRCPGRVIQQTYDLAQRLRDARVTVIGGFHSPMERECLRLLLASPHPVVLCPARVLPRRLPPAQRHAVEDGRLLVLSPFAHGVRRADEGTAHARNRFVAALATALFFAHAAPASKTEYFAREIAGWDKPFHTFAGNPNLIALGAQPLAPGGDVRALV
jgi:predicted Rossmann fold nucleotide-binding protein DprA/Smf involved in DNA uptake